ncbi:putative cysteine protease [Feldmannia species virus]|uniref:Putative cysteine protease n=1 Tax=Feldmannia species virus TaxID=39420 RepID=B5LWL5_9PHYC|nr:putative cysteine protease [Feldmannia species virus]ACH46878.1 putative cysteine protease [Feldmannia species virus]
MRVNITPLVVVTILLLLHFYLKKRPRRKTYTEFVELALCDHERKIGIPWVQLEEDVGDALPSYLKYKERLLTPVVDQGKCASCWSISVVQMLADRVSVYTGGKVRKRLSVQEMISCWDGHDGLACSKGGVPEEAYQYIVENGIGMDEDYPYEQSNSDDIRPCVPSRLKGPRLYVQGSSVRSLCIDPYEYEQSSGERRGVIDMNICNMKKELLMNGPFVCTIMVYQNLYDYDGLSVYQGHDDSEFVGGHSVVCVGYCDEGINGVEPGFDVPGGYWVIRNSWSDWPLKSPASEGYFYIQKGSNVCGIESRASRALVVPTDEILNNTVANLNESRYVSYTSYVNDPDRQLLVSRVTKLRSKLASG